MFRLALRRRSLAGVCLFKRAPLNLPEEQLQLREQVDQQDLHQAVAKLLHKGPRLEHLKEIRHPAADRSSPQQLLQLAMCSTMKHRARTGDLSMCYKFCQQPRIDKLVEACIVSAEGVSRDSDSPLGTAVHGRSEYLW